jgi:hypothetical protein
VDFTCLAVTGSSGLVLRTWKWTFSIHERLNFTTSSLLHVTALLAHCSLSLCVMLYSYNQQANSETEGLQHCTRHNRAYRHFVSAARLTKITQIFSGLREVTNGKQVEAKSEFEWKVGLAGCNSQRYRIQADQLANANPLIRISTSPIERIHNLWWWYKQIITYGSTRGWLC